MKKYLFLSVFLASVSLFAYDGPLEPLFERIKEERQDALEKSVAEEAPQKEAAKDTPTLRQLLAQALDATHSIDVKTVTEKANAFALLVMQSMERVHHLEEERAAVDPNFVPWW